MKLMLAPLKVEVILALVKVEYILAALRWKLYWTSKVGRYTGSSKGGS